MEERVGVVDSYQLATHVLKQDVARESAVHHVHVHFPHAPANVDRLLEVVEEFDIAGLVEVELFQIFVQSQYLVELAAPEAVVILDEWPDRHAKTLLPLKLLGLGLDQHHGQVAAAVLEAPVPTLHGRQRKLFRAVLHAVPAKVDPEPTEKRRPRRNRVGRIEKPGRRLFQVSLLVKFETWNSWRCHFRLNDGNVGHDLPPNFDCFKFPHIAFNTSTGVSNNLYGGIMRFIWRSINSFIQFLLKLSIGCCQILRNLLNPRRW
ncbi:protein of unknown function [Georgfuchsia toluolica]|uniref:Uncharacterized protein n=1 Tax=Georgfuchsia toluolica TaxID=424218 RepID=A0A916J3G8_9PROT|nr:protein of unknown function [Georgfuchsia toluolica]